MKKTFVWSKIITDFLIGGGLITSAIFVGMLTSPLIGGLIAALPIRVGITILLGGIHEGTEFATKMLEGSLLTFFGTFTFLLGLYYGIPRFGLLKGFALASVGCLIVVVITFKLAGKF